MKTFTEQKLKEFDEKYQSFELCTDIDIKSWKRLRQWLSSTLAEAGKEQMKEAKKIYKIWLTNHHDAYNLGESTEPLWWVNNCLGDIFGSEFFGKDTL